MDLRESLLVHGAIMRDNELDEEDEKEDEKDEGGASQHAEKKRGRSLLLASVASLETTLESSTGHTNRCIATIESVDEDEDFLLQSCMRGDLDSGSMRKSVLSTRKPGTTSTPVPSSAAQLRASCSGKKDEDVLAGLPFEFKQDPTLVSRTHESGFHFLLQPNKTEEARLHVQFGVRVGSYVEEEHEKGLAHLVEHLVFRKTKYFKDGDINLFLESLGLTLGACANAITTCTSTRYFLRVAVKDSNSGPFLERVFDLFLNMAFALDIDEEVLESEKLVVLEELRLKDAMPIKGSLENHYPIGKAEIIKSFSIDTVVNFYRKWYRPENMGIMVCGDLRGVTEEQVYSMLSKLLASEKFASLPALASKEPAAIVPSIPPASSPYHLTKMRAYNHHAKDREMAILYRFEDGRAPRNLDDLRMFLIRTMIQKFMDDQLNQSSSLCQDALIQIQSSSAVMAHGLRVNMICMVGSDLKVAGEVLHRILVFGMHKAAFFKVRTELKSLIDLMAMKNTKERTLNTSADNLFCQFLDKAVCSLDRDYEVKANEAVLSSITLGEVNAVLHGEMPEFWKVFRLMYWHTQPKPSLLPEEMETILDTVLSVPPKPFVEKSKAAPIDFPRPPGKIVNRWYSRDDDMWTLECENRIRITFTQSDAGGSTTISSSAKSPVKLGDELLDSMIDLYIHCFNLFGHPRLSAADVREHFSGDVSFELGRENHCLNIKGDCSAADTEKLLHLFCSLFAEDVVCMAGREVQLGKMLNQIFSMLFANPDMCGELIFDEIVLEAVSTLDPLRLHEQGLLTELVNLISASDAQRVLDVLTALPYDFHFAIVAPLSVEEVEALLCKTIASLPMPELVLRETLPVSEKPTFAATSGPGAALLTVEDAKRYNQSTTFLRRIDVQRPDGADGKLYKTDATEFKALARRAVTILAAFCESPKSDGPPPTFRKTALERVFTHPASTMGTVKIAIPLKRKHDMATWVLGSILEQRLLATLRHEMHAVYTVSVATTTEPVLYMKIAFECDPANAWATTQAAKKLCAEFFEKGPTRYEVNLAREELTTLSDDNMRGSRQDNSKLSHVVAQGGLIGDGTMSLVPYEERLAKFISYESISPLRALGDPTRMVNLVMLPVAHAPAYQQQATVYNVCHTAGRASVGILACAIGIGLGYYTVTKLLNKK